MCDSLAAVIPMDNYGNNALDPIAGILNSDIEYSIQVLRKVSKIIYTP